MQNQNQPEEEVNFSEDDFTQGHSQQQDSSQESQAKSLIGEYFFKRKTFIIIGLISSLIFFLGVAFFYWNQIGIESSDSVVDSKESINQKQSLTKKERLANEGGGVIQARDLSELRDQLKNQAMFSDDNWFDYEIGIRDFSGLSGDQLGSDFFSGQMQGADFSETSFSDKNDYSLTNNQIATVDEGDIVKTNGDFIYLAREEELFIFKPGDGGVGIEKLYQKIYPGIIRGLHLKEDKLVILSDKKINNPSYNHPYDSYYYQEKSNTHTFVEFLGVKDPKNPLVLKNFTIENSFYKSRMIDEHLYLITLSSLKRYFKEIELPLVYEGEKALYTEEGGNCSGDCPDFYYSELAKEEIRIAQITSFDLMKKQELVDVDLYYMPGSQVLFASEDNLYFTYTETLDINPFVREIFKEEIYPELTVQQREMLEEIWNASSYVLSGSQKIDRASELLAVFDPEMMKKLSSSESDFDQLMMNKLVKSGKSFTETIIFKVSLDNGNLKPMATGRVPGRINNQFSMDQQAGYFRVATTELILEQNAKNIHTNTSVNGLYVLDEELNIVGQVGGLAKDERIYAVRFFWDKAFIVTFKEVDPLFVIDLSVPSNPTVLGELKIPGFSNYLHPYGNDHLIGIGKEGSNLKLSLFDVSNFNLPREVDSYILSDKSYSDSLALREHRAFLFSERDNLIVLPVDYNYKSFGIEEVPADGVINSSVSKRFKGAMVFSINKSGFTLKGEIEHSVSDSMEVWRGYQDNSADVLRSWYIDQSLYTFSPRYLQRNELKDLTGKGIVDFDKIVSKKEKPSDGTLLQREPNSNDFSRL